MSLWGHFWVPNMVLWYICLWWIIQFLKFRFLKFKFFHNKFFFWTGSCRMEPAVSVLRELVKGVSETCEFSPIGDAHLVPLLHCLIGQVNNWLSVTKLSSAVVGLCLPQQVSWCHQNDFQKLWPSLDCHLTYILEKTVFYDDVRLAGPRRTERGEELRQDGGRLMFINFIILLE